jgi:hypothetical protein
LAKNLKIEAKKSENLAECEKKKKLQTFSRKICTVFEPNEDEGKSRKFRAKNTTSERERERERESKRKRERKRKRK